MDFLEIGSKVLDALGVDVCIARYKTNDPEWVGALALRYGHITGGGELTDA